MNYYINYAGQQYKVMTNRIGQKRIQKSEGYIAYGGDVNDPLVREFVDADYDQMLKDAVPLF